LIASVITTPLVVKSILYLLQSVCEQEGILASVERLPGSGILKKAAHKNNVKHRF
jgi:hypothetical protein